MIQRLSSENICDNAGAQAGGDETDGDLAYPSTHYAL
jgi:hypothetical protein